MQRIDLGKRPFLVGPKQLTSFKSFVVAYRHVYSGVAVVRMPSDYLRLKVKHFGLAHGFVNPNYA